MVNLLRRAARHSGLALKPGPWATGTFALLVLTACNLPGSPASTGTATSTSTGTTTSTSTSTATGTAVAPTITTQPAAQSVRAGRPAVFSVVATGSAPLSYQWQKNGAAIAGAASATYTTPATTGSDNGAVFAVKVSNSKGSVQSAGAVLTVDSGVVRDVSCNGNNISSALASAISASSTGDTVRISAGNCSMSKITINNKNVTISGAGKDATIITANDGFATINSSGGVEPRWRISSMTLSGSGSPQVLSVWSSDNSPIAMRGPFRIDNIKFNYPEATGGGTYSFWGPVYGLIDHNDFVKAGGVFLLTSMDVEGETCFYNWSWLGGGCDVNKLGGGTMAALPYEPGGARNIYVENNTFTAPGVSGFSAAFDTAYTGGRVVFRYNTLHNAMMYAHWTNGNTVNHLWLEVYNNHFTWDGGEMYPIRLHGGGTGLIYNNTFSGFSGNYILIGDGRLHGQTGDPLQYCDGTHPWDGNKGDPAAPGWPCLAQIGRDAGKSISQIMAGNKQGSFPLYLWNNGPQAKCSDSSASGAACDNSFGVNIYGDFGAYFKSTPHPNGDVDWSKTAIQPAGAGTHSLKYTPIPYPYPLTTNGLPNPP